MSMENRSILQSEIRKVMSEATAVPRIDVMPSVVDSGNFTRIIGAIPEMYADATLAGAVARESNTHVIGQPKTQYSVALEPSSREADFIGQNLKPIEVVDAIGGVSGTYLQNYERRYGSDRLARFLSIARSGALTKTPSPQREEDLEVIEDIDGWLGSVKRFAASQRTPEAVAHMNGSYALVGRYGKLDYELLPDGTVKRTMSVPVDKRVESFERDRIQDILPRLSYVTRRGYQALAQGYKIFGDAAVRVAIGTL